MSDLTGKLCRGTARWFLPMMLLCLPGTPLAQSLQTILTNGPSSNRLNVVFLSEGYTAAQSGKFLGDATNAMNAILARAPFSEYRNYFNAFGVWTASPQSGSDHPAYGVYRQTYFNSSYDAQSDSLITVPPNSFDTNAGHGQGKVDTLLQTFMPDCGLAVLLVNDPVPGGSDGRARTAIAYNGAGLSDILLHESGHVLGSLGDEYTNALPEFPDIEEPNTTRETNRSSIKWRAWITPETPVPTPPASAYDQAVGLFPGAHYHTAGWYRPKLDCTMNHPTTRAFCEVCQEAVVLALYARVRPVDAVFPVSPDVSITKHQPLTFSVRIQAPSAHALSVQWSMNGRPLLAETNSTFTLLPLMLPNGSYVLRVDVFDRTARVRSDPSGLLRETRLWNLAVNLPSLSLDSPRIESGKFWVRVFGSAPAGFVIERSGDLVRWTPLATNILQGGVSWFSEPAHAPAEPAFFRARAQQGAD